MSDRDLTHLHPQTLDKVKHFLNSAAMAGFSILVTDGFRSFAEQDDLYAQGRSKPGNVVTHAKGGQSFHNVRRAVDCCFLDGNEKPSWAGPWDRLGSLGRAAGLHWGGDWTSIKDRPHFEDQWCSKHQMDHHKATSFDESGDCIEDPEV